MRRCIKKCRLDEYNICIGCKRSIVEIIEKGKNMIEPLQNKYIMIRAYKLNLEDSSELALNAEDLQSYFKLDLEESTTLQHKLNILETALSCPVVGYPYAQVLH